MAKTDKSLHRICIASIKRHTMKPYDFKYTSYYESKEEFEKLRNGDFSYKLAFIDRIDEIRNLQRKQWELFDKYSKKEDKQPYLQQRCLIELRSLTETLTNLYDLLPAVDSLQNARAEFKENNQFGKPDPNRKF